MTEDIIVDFDHFNFKYKDRDDQCLSNINLKIHKGECIVLTGSSGSGKTTITRCINGLIPTFYEGCISGKCTVCNMDIEEHETGDFAPYIGSVFQDPRSQFFTLHTQTEIAFPGENLGIKRDILQNNYTKSVTELKIEHLIDKKIFNLSSGEKQSVALASVYAADVKVYVLDEPSANLDFASTKQLQNVLGLLKAAGHTIIISEHKLYYLKDIADRFVILKNGRITETIPSDELNNRSPEWFETTGIRQPDLANIRCTPVTIPPCAHTFHRLDVENLSFGYHRRNILWHDVSFSCKSGDIVGIVGKNGAGKSTLLRVLMGLEKERSGRIFINNSKTSPKTRRNQSFYVMQDVDYQLFSGSVLQEMLLGHEKERDGPEKAGAILNTFQLKKYENVHPGTLSGGQKQRLSIALSCMSDSSLLFFDEPTSGLDSENMKLVRSEIIEQASHNKIIFVITHDYEFASSLFTSLLVINEDQTITRITPEQYQPELLSTIFKMED